MKKHSCIIVVLFALAACSCRREAMSEADAPAPVMAIDEDLQRYGEELMQNKEGALLAVDPSTGAILASVFRADCADSLSVIELAKKCMAEGFPKVSPEEVEGMWRDVNGAPGTGSRLWVAHVDGLDVCGKGVPISADEKSGVPVFLGFAPRDNPRIAILSYIKGRPWTATYSAPIGSLMIERYLNGAVRRQDLEMHMLKARPLSR